MGPEDADRMANSVDHDQTAPAPLGAVWSVCTLFAQTCLSVRKPRNIMVSFHSLDSTCTTVTVMIQKIW